MAANYIRAALGEREPLLNDILREAILGRRLRPMQIDDNAARILRILTMIRKPRRAIEIGTYFGYSAIHIARGLPPGGTLTTLESDAEVAQLASENFVRANVDDRIKVIVGDATDYLVSVIPRSIGLIFIDADKKNYPLYLKLCFPLLESGGLLVADDAFADGDFAAESSGDGATEIRAINTYNRAVLKSNSLLSGFIGTNNGLLVSVKS